MVIDGFEYLLKANNIEGIDLDVFYELLQKKENEVYNNYSIKKVLVNTSDKPETKGIFFFSTETNSRTLVNCVNEYYEIGNINSASLSCMQTQNELSDLSDKHCPTNCRECHLNALSLYKNNKLKKK